MAQLHPTLMKRVAATTEWQTPIHLKKKKIAFIRMTLMHVNMNMGVRQQKISSTIFLRLYPSCIWFSTPLPEQWRSANQQSEKGRWTLNNHERVLLNSGTIKHRPATYLTSLNLQQQWVSVCIWRLYLSTLKTTVEIMRF